MRDKHFRRRQEARARHRAVRSIKRDGLPLDERRIHLYQTCRTPCSCYWCTGNKREEHRVERKEAKKEIERGFSEMGSH